jgi:hypothetical protein
VGQLSLGSAQLVCRRLMAQAHPADPNDGRLPGGHS